MNLNRHTLENGLELVAECDGGAHSIALGFFVRTGSRDETDEVSGVSHFLEHMAFKGTPNRSADEVNRAFDEMGAHYNAFTSEEETVYYAAVLPECQQRVLELLADLLRPALRPEDFDTEKQVILEEIAMHEDQPPFGADEKVKAAHYGPHPLGRSVLGTAKSVTALSVEAMRDYFQRRYSPDNIVLAAAGRIDFDALVASAARACGAWERRDASRLVERPACRDSFQSLYKKGASQQYVLQLAVGPAADDPARFAAKLLATMLGDDTGSRLYWDLVDPGLAEQAGVNHFEYLGAGGYMTFMSCDPKLAAKNLQLMTDAFRRAEREAFTAVELEQAASKLRSRIVLSGELPRGRLFSVGTDWIHRGVYRAIADDLAAVAAVTLDEVAEVLAQYPLTHSTTVAIGPLKKLKPPK